MKLKINLKHIARPAKIFMTVFILLIAVLILQGIILEAEQMSAYKKRRSAETKSKAELTQQEKRLDRIKNSVKEFLPDGTIHLIYKPKHIAGRRGEFETEQIYDVNDNLLWEGPQIERPYEYLSWAGRLHGKDSFTYHRVDFTLQRLKQIQTITPVFSQNIEVPVRSGDKTRQIWRYHPGRDVFVGYHFKGEKIGYAGSTGFTDSKSKTKPFGKFRVFNAWCPEDSTSPTLLWQTQRRIFQINFEKQNVELIFESIDADIRTIGLNAWVDPVPGTKEYFDRDKYRPLIHCLTEDNKHHLIMRNPQQRLTFSIPEDWKDWVGSGCGFTATKQNIYLLRNWIEFRAPPDYFQDEELHEQWRRDYQSKPKTRWVELYKMDNQGGLELLNRYDWTLPPPPSVPVVKARDPRPAVKRYVSQISPPFYDYVLRLLGRKFWSWALDYQNRGDFFYSLARMVLDIRPYGGVINRVLSALMIGFAFLHGWSRRTSWPKFVFWLVFVGIFNLAGLLTYLALNHTAVIKCPICGKRRGLAQVDCVRCQAELPAPERGKLDLIFST